MHPLPAGDVYAKALIVMRTDDAAGDQWHEVMAPPSDCPIGVHAYELKTLRGDHQRPSSLAGRQTSYCSGPVATSGSFNNGLPQENCYVNALRDATSIDRLGVLWVYFGTTAGGGLRLGGFRRQLTTIVLPAV